MAFNDQEYSLSELVNTDIRALIQPILSSKSSARSRSQLSRELSTFATWASMLHHSSAGVSPIVVVRSASSPMKARLF